MPTGIFEQEEQAKRDAEESRQSILKLHDALKSVMATEHGRLSVSWILSLTGQRDSLSVRDAMQMAVLSGRRDVGLQVLRKLNDICPERVDQMLVEERDARRS